MSSHPIMNLVSKLIPLNTGGTALQVNQAKKIITSSALEFSEQWQNFCTAPMECTCGEVTEEGSQFVDFLSSLLANEDLYLYEDPFAWSNVLLYHSNGPGTSDDSYYKDYPGTGTQDFFDELLVAIDGHAFTEPKGLYYVSKVNEINPHLLDIRILRDVDENHFYDQGVCVFQLEFIKESDGSHFNLSNLTLTGIFEDPDFIETFTIAETPSGDCNDIYDFTWQLEHVPSGNVVLVTPIDFGCFSLRDCDIYTTYCSGGEGDVVNPYTFGALGRWKQKANYMFKTDRESSTPVSMRNDGAYSSFTPFWQLASGTWSKNISGWQLTTESQLHNPYIDELENQNALEIYSSAQYGYDNTLADMVVNNAAFKEIGYESFEDDKFEIYKNKTCFEERFDFSGDLSNLIAHTGNFSLKIRPEETTSIEANLSYHSEIRDIYHYSNGSLDGFKVISEDCLPKFSPDLESEQEYIMSFWALELGHADPVFSYDNVAVDVRLQSGLSTTIEKGPIIDGWQLFNCYFIIPKWGDDIGEDPEEDLIIRILNNSEEIDLYVDDIRIHPVDAMAKCYIYDYRTQWLMAEMDEKAEEYKDFIMPFDMKRMAYGGFAVEVKG